MVALLRTPALLSTLKSYSLLYDLPATITSSFDDESIQSTSTKTIEEQPERTISHQSLVEVIQWTHGHPVPKVATARQTKKSKGRDVTVAPQPSLTYLMTLTTLYTPALAPRKRSPELLAILAKLQLEADQRLYNSMTSLSVFPSSASPLAPFSASSNHATSISNLSLRDPYASKTEGTGGGGEKEVWGEVGKEITAICNVAASMLAMGVSVWWVGGGRSVALRLSLSLTASFLIGCVETFLYYRHFTRKATGLKERQKMKDARETRLNKERLEMLESQSEVKQEKVI